jgi:hypothetical protein
MPEKCHAIGCSNPAISKGLCDKHRKRLARHGSIEETRPSDWGRREKHPAYRSWCGLIRYYKNYIPQEWNEFWNFVRDVPERPERGSYYRQDQSKPFSKDNFYWKVPRLSKELRQDRAAYMREWQRKARAADPDYGKNAYMKRIYKVDLDWFNRQFDLQKGVCAICDKPETTVIHGRQISLAVDHCHDTGRVRGLLCRGCNNSIGHFNHNIRILKSAIDYLRKHDGGASISAQNDAE